MTKRYNFCRTLRFAWQRLTQGWDDSDTWSLDAAIARFAVPRLRRFRKIRGGYPIGMSDQEWDTVLSDIEFYLERVRDCYVDVSLQDMTPEDKRFTRGRRLWRKHFEDLWW